MKKSLYLTSALVAASVLALGSTDAMAKAKPMKLTVSGTYKAVVGYAKQASGFQTFEAGSGRTSHNTIDVKTDSEVHFNASGTTDSGLNVGVRVELETDQSSNAGDHIDGSWMTLGGGFGTLMIGSGAAAAAVLAVNAPSTGAVGVFGGDSNSWIVKPGNVAVSAVVGANIGGNDRAKLRWTSPSFSGFSAGASYVPDLTSQDGAMPSNGGNGGTDASQVDVALRYTGKMGTNTVSGSAGWWAVDQTTTAANANTSTEGYSLGASTTMGAITMGAGYKEIATTGKQLSTATTGGASISGTATSLDEEAVNIGIAWNQGKTTIALNYFNVEKEMATATDGEDSVTKWTLGLQYVMGPGINFLGTVQNVNWQDEGTLTADNNKGTAFVGGVSVAF
jgi:outer membrane protein OmpU